jgi:hypothetical protein
MVRRPLACLLAAGLLLPVVAAVGWAALAPVASPDREVVFVVARGTAARQARGERVKGLPAVMRFTLGVRDVLVLRNEDDAPVLLGPVLLAPHQSYRIPFTAPSRFDLACSAHPDGRVAIVVDPAPAAGWARLRWRLTPWLGQ